MGNAANQCPYDYEVWSEHVSQVVAPDEVLEDEVVQRGKQDDDQTECAGTGGRHAGADGQELTERQNGDDGRPCGVDGAAVVNENAHEANVPLVTELLQFGLILNEFAARDEQEHIHAECHQDAEEECAADAPECEAPADVGPVVDEDGDINTVAHEIRLQIQIGAICCLSEQSAQAINEPNKLNKIDECPYAPGPGSRHDVQPNVGRVKKVIAVEGREQ